MKLSNNNKLRIITKSYHIDLNKYQEMIGFLDYKYILDAYESLDRRNNPLKKIEWEKNKKRIFWDNKYSTKEIINCLISSLSKGKANIFKKLYILFLTYYKELLNYIFIINNSKLYNNLALERFIYRYFCVEKDVFLERFNKFLYIKNGGLLNINTLINISVKSLYLNIGFFLTTNIKKGKKKLKEAKINSRHLFLRDKKRQAIRHIVKQILTNQEFTFNNEKKDKDDYKNQPNLRLRLNWSLGELLFNTKNSIFYKRKWSIFYKYYLEQTGDSKFTNSIAKEKYSKKYYKPR